MYNSMYGIVFQNYEHLGQKYYSKKKSNRNLFVGYLVRTHLSR